MLTRDTQTPETSSTMPAGKPNNRLVSIFFVVLLIIVVAAFAYFTSEHEKKPPEVKRAAVVRVASVEKANVPRVLRALGHVEPMSTVAVRSRVDGELVDVLFAEGDRVKTGQRLFTIDPRPFDEAIRQLAAKVAQAKADVSKCRSLIAKDRSELTRLAANRERDMAEEANARRDHARYQELVKEGAVSVEQENRYATNVASLSATVKADTAAMENEKSVIQSDQAQLEAAQAALKAAESDFQNAQLQRSYCSITAPMDGKTGALLVHRGQMVKAGDTSSLVVINKVKPVYVSFSVPEQDLPRIHELQKQHPLQVGVEGLPEHVGNVTGTLTFIDNSVQRNTGTILMKATFANENEVLWPGTYVKAVLNLDTIYDATVVPTQAVQVGQQGQYVYVVGPDNKANLVTVKIKYSDGTTSVIEGNLKPGEQIVVDGHMQLMPGAPVEIQPSAPTQTSTP
ncbi:MAG TPA: efflux RND transporter periplasmic adaptor subunit [Candidatus Melainabacteria bacterium]|jgi:membrane fusion protein, multidrug efflux system|nr:efflux RND transporter periplasmic adaptor subunit [Candidatus Melainabacteria bacterium]HIN66902.1 efflux RND transporter periplasmic adaptor subunit [Candidatus Obscuribacterales bacterium]